MSQKTSQNGQWQIVGAAAVRKFAHPNQTPGRNVLYRVVVQQAGQESAPRTETVAYENATLPIN